jgi:outer membrane murein-binding lipoprotein Lpp
VKRILIALLTLLVAGTAFAQDAQDLDRRLKAIEEKIDKLQSPDVAELRREIDVLSREIEALKQSKVAAPEASMPAQNSGLGVAASKVYRSEPGVSIGGYGEFAYIKGDGDFARADVLRAVLYTGYKFSNRALFNSELEVEDASTEAGGNVNIEFAYLDYLLHPGANVRAGLVLVPMGLVNEQHEPTAYLASTRPLTETLVIPATWSELGGGVFGDSGRWSYRAYLMTGLRGAAFTSEEGLREGRQGGGNAIAEDFAAVGRADFHPFEGTMFGGSLYSGNSGQGARSSTGSRIHGKVTLGEVHADSHFRGVSLRALYARGTAGDTTELAESTDAIAHHFNGWYFEGGYDIASMFARGNQSITPFVRYERVNTGLRATVFTTGVAWKPMPQSVVKVDWQKPQGGTDRYDVSLGYIF